MAEPATQRAKTVVMRRGSHFFIATMDGEDGGEGGPRITQITRIGVERISLCHIRVICVIRGSFFLSAVYAGRRLVMKPTRWWRNCQTMPRATVMQPM